MNAIKPLAITDDTVLLSRLDYEALLEAVEEAGDITRVKQARIDLAEGRSEILPGDMVKALCAGANPVRVWREHRGLSGRELAEASGVNAAYLSEIETGKKPGSAIALRKLAAVLHIDMEDLIAFDD
ncbi:MAG: helix-turn-helix domain-containing protein [Niveispirillum sp.]|nr:helix-turn-helix domain-containing protein [Niveispirillum sp.]